jgi:CPA2 family monovalent cation:H+ antiporter-2
MHLDPAMPSIVAMLFIVLVVGIALRAMNQPHVVAYLLAGVAVGPHGLAVVPEGELVGRVGALGVVLLLFFVGMEVSPQRLATTWRVSLVGTALQVVASVAVVWVLGAVLDWSIERIVLIGFVISLSSTAVVLKVLESWQQQDTREGRDILGVLLTQDLFVVPMVIVVGLLSGESSEVHWGRQVVGTILLTILVWWVFSRDELHLPFRRILRADRELQVFAGFAICFGLALITGLFDLSSALGAFVAGMVVGAARETKWVHESLEPFRVVLLALFFLSVGMLLDIDFVRQNIGAVSALLLLALLTGTLINGLILRALGYTWRASLYAGCILAPIGEFSFVLAAVGAQSGIVVDYGYQMAIGVIALSLVVSPMWMSLGRRIHDDHSVL